MKNKNLFLFLATLMLTMYSCSNDNKNIVGTWEYKKSYAEVEVSPAERKEKIEKSFLDNSKDYVRTIEFRSDGTATETETFSNKKKTYTSELIYTLSGNKLTITYNKEDEEFEDEEDKDDNKESYTYEVEISDNSLTTKFDLLMDKEFNDLDGKLTKLIEVEVFKKK